MQETRITHVIAAINKKVDYKKNYMQKKLLHPTLSLRKLENLIYLKQ